jgi:DNA mismatch repair protein MutL
LLPTRRFPAAILFIEVPVDQVDVNVHPTKREVKFQKDREIYDMIVRAIRDTLLSTGTAAPPQESAATPPLVNVAYSSLRSTPSFLNEPPLTAGTRADSLWTTDQSPSSAASYSTVPISGHGSGLENMGFGNGILQADRIDPSLQLYNFSQLFNTFIVFQSDSEMYIADQHTVHERLNYERLMKGVLEKKLEVQPLLVPITVELSAKEAQVLRNNLEVLLELGMEMAPFGGNTFLVRSVSADLADRNVLSLVKDLVDDLAAQENSGIKTTNRADMARERAATFMSCRSAMMAGDRLNEEQMRSLIDQMRQANLPFTCPHGRPTILSIPLSELYRRFDRH